MKQDLSQNCLNTQTLKIAFTSDNKIERILSTKHEPVQNKYDKCGIHQLTCPTCKMTYTEQTGRPFKTRFQEHQRDFKYGSNKSKFAQQLLDNRHAIGPTNNIMETTYITNKGKMMDTIEIYYISRETKNNNQINPLNAELNPICHLLALLGAHHILYLSRIRVNDKLTVKPNAIFDVVVREDPYRGRINPIQPDDTLITLS